MKDYYVYIMSNKNNTTLYIGVTNDIVRRIYEHKNKILKGFTEKYNLEKLVFLEEVSNVESAISREKQLKGWTRKKKESLILQQNPNWVDLSVKFKFFE